MSKRDSADWSRAVESRLCCTRPPLPYVFIAAVPPPPTPPPPSSSSTTTITTAVPILEDVYRTPTWAALEKAGEAGIPTGWVYPYASYMRRPEWELFDIQADPLCLHNLVGNRSAAATLSRMQAQLRAWRLATNDPWVVCTTAAAPGQPWADEHSEICSF